MPTPRSQVQYVEYAAPPALARTVLAVWRFRVPEDVVFATPFSIWPDASASVVLPGRGHGPAVVSGPRDAPGQVPVNSGDETWGVKWWPDCAGAALGVAARALVGNITLAPAVIANELAPVRDAIRGGASPDTIRDALWTWAAVRVARMPPPDVRVRAAIQVQVSSRGALPIHELATSLGVSSRTLARTFAVRVGLSPKVFARICRFRYALERLSAHPPESLAAHAAGAGYADESHLFREFRTLTGLGPKEIARRLALTGADGV